MKYEFKHAKIGGGGFITGIIQSVFDPKVLYVRCDVGGMYKSTDGGKTFRDINKYLDHPAQHCVESIAVSTHKEGVVLRCSGEARNNISFGFIHKSTDGGESWKLVSQKCDFIGNGDTRYMGEMIEIDPFNENNVVCCSFSKGLFISRDGGEEFNFVGFKGEPLKTVKYHPIHKNVIYVGSLSYVAHKSYLYPDEYKSDGLGKLYCSKDGGENFECIYTGKIDFCQIDIADDIIYVASGFKGIFKSTDGGISFEKADKNLPECNYSNIACSKKNSGVIFVAANVGPDNPNVPTIPLYKSEDYGNIWKIIKEYKASDFSNYPCKEDIRSIGWSISKFIPSYENDDNLFMSNWFGVSESENGGESWNGNNYDGIENVCLESIIRDPLDSNTVYLALADDQIQISRDNGRTYKSFPYIILKNNYYCSSSMAASSIKDGFLLYGISNNSSHQAAVCRTFNRGETAQCVWELNDGLYVQCIREAKDGGFYVYIDGSLKDGAGIFYTCDYGTTFIKLRCPFPKYMNYVPFHKRLVEEEILSVTWYQTKNVCGTNKMLEVNNMPNSFYVGEWTEGIFYTENQGESYINIAGDLPFLRSRASILNVIYYDKQADTLYAGFVSEGLYATKDNGVKWEKIFPNNNEKCNVSQIAKLSENELIFSCEPLGSSLTKSEIYIIDKDGKDSVNIYNQQYGCLRFKGISVNPKNKDIAVITCGNGAFYGMRK